MASTRRYIGLTNRREVGKYGDGSIGAVGAAACNGLTRMKPAPCRAADQTASSVRSVKSPMPQDLCERTLYNWVARPHARPVGGSKDGGDTTMGELMSDEPSCRCTSWYPSGRSAGSSKLASPTRRPSRS